MNKLILNMIAFGFLTASLNVSADVLCEGATHDEGYGFYHTQLKYNEQNNSLSNIEAAVHFVNAEGYSDQVLDLQNHQTEKDQEYQPRKSEYAGMKRYILSRGWTNYFLVTPENETGNEFVAYLQQAGHDYAETITLVCHKN